MKYFNPYLITGSLIIEFILIIIGLLYSWGPFLLIHLLTIIGIGVGFVIYGIVYSDDIQNKKERGF